LPKYATSPCPSTQQANLLYSYHHINAVEDQAMKSGVARGRGK